MAVHLVLAVSIGLQLVAAFMALRLIRVTGHRLAWVFVAAAILLMVVRRLVTLSQSLLGTGVTPQLTPELVALAISGLMVAGVALIRPVFEELLRSETVLRESRSRLAQAQRIARLGDWEWVPASARVYCPEHTCRLMGLDPAAFDGRLETFFSTVHPDDHARVKQAMQQCLSDGAGCSDHFRVASPEGGWRHIHGQGWVEHEPDGKVRRLFGTVQDVTEQRLAEEQVVASERELSAILANMQDTYYRTDTDGRILRVSDSVYALLGYAPEEMLGTLIAEYYENPLDRDRLLEQLQLGDGSVTDFEARLCRRDGSMVWVSTNARYCRDEEGTIVGVEGTTRDITARKQAGEQMRKLSSALEQTADCVIITDPVGTIEYVNPAFEQVTGYTQSEAEGRTPRIIKSGMHNDTYYETMWRTIRAGNVYRDVVVNRRKDGSLYYEEKAITPLKDVNGYITHFISTGKDITERMQIQERLHYLAHHDALTELPNRALLNSRLEHVLKHARREGEKVAVLFMDLDSFKDVNDSLGHDIGDSLLRDIGERLKGCVRESDTLARLGGDEFTILMEDVSDNHEASLAALRLLDAFAQPFELEGREIFLSASIGISVYPMHGDEPSTLLKNADAAMYRAKARGRNTYEFYSADMETAALERLNLEADLRRALEREEFFLVYQLQHSVSNSAIVGVEALLRWAHPERGVVSPAHFIPTLEETGLIVPVGEWVLRTACEQAQRWLNEEGAAVRMAVNLSRRQLDDPTFCDRVEQILADTGVDPFGLEFEITESLVVDYMESKAEILSWLGERGVSLAIDDFGIGYSSLSYLKRLPIHTLKIDRAFIRDIEADADDAAIVSAILAMARQLKLRVVAEGVETQGQLAFLREHGCDLSQGFLHSRPCLGDDIATVLHNPAAASSVRRD